MNLLARSIAGNSVRYAFNASKKTAFCNSCVLKLAAEQNPQPPRCVAPNFFGIDSVRRVSTAAAATAATETVLQSTLVERLSQNGAVYVVQQKLIDFHDISGLPWWAVIVITTVALRALIVFPLAVHQQFSIAKMAEIDKELETRVSKEVSKTVRALAEEKQWNSSKLAREYNNSMFHHREQLCKKNNTHPQKTMVIVLIQVPVWLALSGSIRNLCSMIPVRDEEAMRVFLEMKASGFGFIKDLTVPDSTWMLPLIIVVTNLIIIELNRMSRIQKNNMLTFGILNLIRMVTVGSFPFLINIPKCMTLFWATSTICGLVQNILFIIPKTRKLLRIPKVSQLREKPFTHMLNKIKSFIYFLKY